MSDLGINSNFKGLLTLLNNKGNHILERLDSQKNGKLDGKISVEDLHLAQKSNDADVKEMANYILDNKDFMKGLGLNPDDKKSKFSIDDAVNLSVNGKINANGDDLKNAANDYDKRNIALNILSQHKNMIDKASDSNNDGKDDDKGTDGNFNLRDLANLAQSDKVPKEVRDAAKVIVSDSGALRDIDGTIDKKDGLSDGNFSWGDFQNTQKNAFAPFHKFDGYKDGENPIATTITDGSNQKTDGDCVFLASLNSLSHTDKGKQIMSDAIKNNPDGSYTVNFKGAPGESIKVTRDEIKDTSLVGGNTAYKVLAVAADKHFKDQGGLVPNTGKTMNLLLGDDQEKQTHEKMYPDSGDKDKDIKNIKQFLIDSAPHVGKDMALNASGGAQNDGSMDWSDTNHEVSITKIEPDPKKPGGGTVTYVNPWDSTKEHTVSIEDMAKGMADSGGSSGLDGYKFYNDPSKDKTGGGGKISGDGGASTIISGGGGTDSKDDSSKSGDDMGGLLPSGNDGGVQPDSLTDSNDGGQANQNSTAISNLADILNKMDKAG